MFSDKDDDVDDDDDAGDDELLDADDVGDGDNGEDEWSGCVPIYSHQIWISDIFGSAGFRVFFFTEFPAVNCGIFLGCSFSLSIPSILHTNTHA